MIDWVGRCVAVCSSEFINIHHSLSLTLSLASWEIYLKLCNTRRVRSSVLQCVLFCVWSPEKASTGWRRVIECLIFIDHFLQNSPNINGSFAESDLQLKASYGSLPPCSVTLSLSHALSHTHTHTLSLFLSLSHTHSTGKAASSIIVSLKSQNPERVTWNFHQNPEECQ